MAVIAHDFTVKAGSWGELTCEKQIRILERADRDLLPVVYLVDSAGGRLTDQMGFFPGRRGASAIFHLQVKLSGRVPQLCCLHGPSAAGGAYMPAFCDWVGMVGGQRVDVPRQPAGGREGHRRAYDAGGDGRGRDARHRLRLRRRGVRRRLGGRGGRTAPADLPARRLPHPAGASRTRRARARGLGRAGPHRPQRPLRRSRRRRPDRGRRLVLRDQGPVGAGDGGRPRPARRAGHRDRGEPAERPQRGDLRRLGRQGGSFHLAVRCVQHPAAVPAGRARLHGRGRGRAAGHHPARRQDDRRDGLGGRSEVHAWCCARPTRPATTPCARPASSRARRSRYPRRRSDRCRPRRR